VNLNNYGRLLLDGEVKVKFEKTNATRSSLLNYNVIFLYVEDFESMCFHACVKLCLEVFLMLIVFFCLYQTRLAGGGTVFWTGLSVRLLPNLWTWYLKMNAPIWCQLVQIVHGVRPWSSQLWGSGRQRSRSHEAKFRFGDLALGIIFDPLRLSRFPSFFVIARMPPNNSNNNNNNAISVYTVS